MNKKYIDFVPVAKEARKKPEPIVHTEVSEVTVTEMFEERVERPRAGVTTVRKHDIVVPKAKFVNTEKIAKRPLSKSAKNVYVKKIVEPEEKVNAKPVKIIDKPEKDSKVGMVVAIIITIILGAAAGTVAFLLLPK